jgi:hypothetical protein
MKETTMKLLLTLAAVLATAVAALGAGRLATGQIDPAGRWGMAPEQTAAIGRWAVDPGLQLPQPRDF